MRLGTRQECVLSSPRGIRSLPRWRKGVRQKKTETHRKITRGSRKACWELTTMVKMNYKLDMDLGSSLGIEPRIGRCGGTSPEFARRFIEGIEKLARNTSGDCQRKTVRLITVESGGCRIMGVRS
ncbi:hypothetical protein B296_00005453 [Ensete ventricosum]|uniref:Uncharacterized protein n=1 Tax=Ensete ventricosum TaxID=4639 RepID=A0A426ZQ32_ENSVE|nr:hypothetical protein B296_00005453 [Ensete ventricosum]